MLWTNPKANRWNVRRKRANGMTIVAFMLREIANDETH
jgi:hypothetical protein